MIKRAYLIFAVTFLAQWQGFAQPVTPDLWYFNVDENFLLGKIMFEKNTRFSLVSAKLSTKSCYLLNEVNAAFETMAEAAQKDGVILKVISGGRNFNMQKVIWEKKWNARRANFKSDKETALDILKYSSMPGTSRHHWGTDLDINSLEPSYFASGKGKLEYDWLQKNAANFGFCQTYDNKINFGRTGYSEEKWHYSYMPISSVILKQYNAQISYEKLNGFLGSSAAKDIEVIRVYVSGISTACSGLTFP
jgi:LAS superfamily LD-carboxypeptidase LdcB